MDPQSALLASHNGIGEWERVRKELLHLLNDQEIPGSNEGWFYLLVITAGFNIPGGRDSFLREAKWRMWGRPS